MALLNTPTHALRFFATVTLWILSAAGCASSTTPRPPPEPLTAPQPLTATSKLASADLLADLAVLRNTYEALHPGLTRYNTPEQLDAAFAALAREFSHERTVAEAYLALTAFTARLRCGHSYPNFYNQSEAIQKALFEGPHVPFAFRWIDGYMVVTANLGGDERLRPGTEISRLNGVATSEILAKLMPLARADGSNDAKRISYLGVSANTEYEAFDILHPMLFPWTSDELRIELRGAGGPSASFTVRAQTHAQRLASLSRESEPDGTKPMWALRFLDHGPGYLKMSNWLTYKTRWDWKTDLQHTFETLVSQGSPALIIDLRGNEGGEDVGNELVRHLIDQPLPVRSLQRIVRYRSVPASLRPNLDTWDKSFFDWGPEAHELGGGRFQLVDANPDEDVIAPKAPRFHGKVIVLVDAENSSATFQFAELMQRNKLAALIGEPTGGNQRGINGGAFFFLRLPRTGLEVDVPLIGTFAPAGSPEPPDAGLTPDLLVRTTAQDLAHGRDPQLEAAMAQAGFPLTPP